MATRSEFTKPTKRLALKRSGFLCEAVGIMYGLAKDKRCNAELGSGVEYDHIVRASDGGDSTLDNCAAVCLPCHRFKTAKFDVPQAAKTKRMSDKNNGVVKPKGEIQSRDFAGKKPKQPKGDPFEGLPRRNLFERK